MTFGEKIRQARKELGLTQDELAEKILVSRRIINSYESNKSRPRTLEGYKKLSDVLGIPLNYLRSEEEDFTSEVEIKYGKNAALEAQSLVDNFSALFAGGSLTEAEKDGVMKAIQEVYWDCKNDNIEKYTTSKK